MPSTLDLASAIDVRLDPFPHIILRDAIDPAVCDALIAQYPQPEVITKGKPLNDNTRFSYSAHDVVANPKVAQVWQDFIRTHVSQDFLDQIVQLLEAGIHQRYPHFAEDYAPLQQLRAGIRHQDNFQTADVLMDAQICINSPVITRPTSVRTAHLDQPDKLYFGLFYLRHPADDSTGGELQIFSYKKDKRVFDGCYADEQALNCIATVPYARNVLVLGINTIDSLHGVTLRSVTPHPRLFMNLIGEVRKPLYDYMLPQYQKPLPLGKRIKSLWRKKREPRHADGY